VNDPGVALLFSALIGVALFLAGIVWGNTVLFRMQKALNANSGSGKRVSPWNVMGKGGGRYETFSKYKAKFGHDSLVRQDRLSGYVIMLGAVIGFGSFLIVKVRH
jgi:hypothetical protein